MSNAAIELTDVGKCFTLGASTGSLKDSVLRKIRGQAPAKDEEFWALKDVSFQVRQGETLGIIGSNGAGKSTLLSIITGTMHPTCGAVRTEGSISALLELGAGFHPDLTGRENVYLFGSIMGLSRQQVDKRFDAIVDFAGLERFIDQPVKHYSSGMYVRLGFSVAVEVDPDILLVDEVLAVGDADFQRKCLNRMEEYRQSGKTMLIISHDLKTIQSVSDRIILLDGGRILGNGEPGQIVREYEDMTRERNMKSLRREWGTREAEITRVEVTASDGETCEKYAWDRPLRARIHYRSSIRIEKPIFGFAISDEQGRILAGNNSQIEQGDIPVIEGEGCVELLLSEGLCSSTGTYLLSFSLHSSDHKANYHRLDNLVPVEIVCDRGFEGAYVRSEWRVV